MKIYRKSFSGFVIQEPEMREMQDSIRTQPNLGKDRDISKMTLAQVNDIIGKCLERGDVMSYTYHMAKKRKIELERAIKRQM